MIHLIYLKYAMIKIITENPPIIDMAGVREKYAQIGAITVRVKIPCQKSFFNSFMTTSLLMISNKYSILLRKSRELIVILLKNNASYEVTT